MSKLAEIKGDKSSDEMTHAELVVAYQVVVSDNRSLRVSLDHAQKEATRLKWCDWAIREVMLEWSQDNGTYWQRLMRAWHLFTLLTKSDGDIMASDVDKWRESY